MSEREGEREREREGEREREQTPVEHSERQAGTVRASLSKVWHFTLRFVGHHLLSDV